jgi:4-hydroxy-3-polyprenylbenzoate decarboxylase
MSLAKYLLIASDDNSRLDIHDIAGFFTHVLARADWRRDLHFHTRTTIDTLDYSGSGLNEGSKLVIAAAGPPVRELPTQLPHDLRLPDGFRDPRCVMPGVLTISAPRSVSPSNFCEFFAPEDVINCFPLVVLVDDSEFTSRTLNNFLWVTFTRSNPAADVHGIGDFIEQKHWGCRGALVVDARIKPHHAPPLVEDPQTMAKVDALAARGGPLAKWL